MARANRCHSAVLLSSTSRTGLGSNSYVNFSNHRFQDHMASMNLNSKPLQVWNHSYASRRFPPPPWNPGSIVRELQLLITALHWLLDGSHLSRRRHWHPTPVLLLGKSHGQRSLVGCSPWDRWESDMTERLHSFFTFMHWRRKCQPTPVFLPGESPEHGSLVGCHLWVTQSWTRLKRLSSSSSTS